MITAILAALFISALYTLPAAQAATQRFTGNAEPVKQVDSFTPASVTVGNTFTVTINGKTVTYTAVNATVADVTAGLTALLNASTIAEFAEVTWADGTTKITGTCDTAGRPFTATSSAAQGTGSPGMSLTRAAVTANKGPNCWGVASNWDTGTVPTVGDDVVFDDTAIEVLYDLDQSANFNGTITIGKNYTGKIGLPEYNALGYFEYRETFLLFKSVAGGSTLKCYGEPRRLKVNFGNNAAQVFIYNCGTSADGGLEAVLLGGDKIDVLEVYKGSVCVSPFAGMVSDVGTNAGRIRTGYVSSPATDVALRIGGTGTGTINVTVTELSFNGGVIEVKEGTWDEDIYVRNGATLRNMSTSVAAHTIYNLGGTVDWRQGNINAYVGSAGSTLDFSKNNAPKTVTSCTLAKGAALNDPSSKVTFTNPILLQNCKVTDVTIDLGTNRGLTPDP